MVTALGEVKDRVKALESGADDFLTKPIDKTELRTRVRTLVEKSERIRRLTVQKKRPLVPIVSVIVAVIAAVVSTILIVTNEPVTETDAVVDRYEVGFEAGLKEGSLTVEKEIEQKEFSSKEELKKWLAEDDTDEHVYLFCDAEGIARASDKYDCDDYALQLQRSAAKSGFLTSVTIIEKEDRPHMINLVAIGNDVYYIEPQTDEVWFYCPLD